MASAFAGIITLDIKTTLLLTRPCWMSSLFLAAIGLFNSAMTAGIFDMMFGEDMNPNIADGHRLTLRSDAVLLHRIDALIGMPSGVSDNIP
jgi:hypothetical protein